MVVSLIGRFVSATEQTFVVLLFGMASLNAILILESIVLRFSLIGMCFWCIHNYAKSFLLDKKFSQFDMWACIMLPFLFSIHIMSLVSYHMKVSLKKLNDANMRLETENNAKQAFIRTIGHEIRYVTCGGSNWHSFSQCCAYVVLKNSTPRNYWLCRFTAHSVMPIQFKTAPSGYYFEEWKCSLGICKFNDGIYQIGCCLVALC